ncbi:MAG TPA: response regulator [Gemmatimonadaceae bacterium]|jgi:CheY-like chemotaxis protein
MPMAQVFDQTNEMLSGEREHPLVLLAEDNDDTRGVYGLILRHYGYDVEEATNGVDAVLMIRDLHPNLVLMDIGLPGLDGWQASRILKADPKTNCIPLIAFSARVDSTADLGGHPAFDGYILKPVSPTDLVRRVQSYCELLDITPRRTDS